MKSTRTFGIIFAVMAALLNATIGVISVNLFSNGLTPETVAFLKSIMAFSILLTYVLIFQRKNFISKLSAKWLQISICAFFGFFILYTFETKAYQTLNVAVVVFILFGSSTIVTFILDAILDKRFINRKEVLSISFSLVGLALIFSYGFHGEKVIEGALFAALSGVGYGVFLVLSKRFKIGSDLTTLTLLLGFGTIYLFLSFIYFKGQIPTSDLTAIIMPLLLLAVLPTIGGFYCTIKALGLLKSQSVQLLELTDPVFVLAFAFIFLKQLTTTTQIIGGVLIIISILIYELNFESAFKKTFQFRKVD